MLKLANQAMMSVVVAVIAGSAVGKEPKPDLEDVVKTWGGTLHESKSGDGRAEVFVHLVERSPFCTRITDQALRDIARFEQVGALVLESQSVTDAGLKELRSLPQLRQIVIIGCPLVKGSSLKNLSECKQLYGLTIWRTPITNDGLKNLKDFKALCYLNLSSVEMTEAKMKAIAEIAALKILFLRNCEVTDIGLKELKKLKGLEILDVPGAKLTEAAVKELQEALPKCKIKILPSSK